MIESCPNFHTKSLKKLNLIPYFKIYIHYVHVYSIDKGSNYVREIYKYKCDFKKVFINYQLKLKFKFCLNIGINIQKHYYYRESVLFPKQTLTLFLPRMVDLKRLHNL